MKTRFYALSLAVTIPLLAFAQAVEPAAQPVPASTTATLVAMVFTIAQPVLAALGVALAGYLTVWLRQHVKNQKVADILVRSKDIIFTVVKKLNQTVVTGLKKANADGILTAEEIKAVQDAAVSDVKTLLGPAGIKALLWALGLTDENALEKWIGTQIEAAVHDVKLAALAAKGGKDFQ